MAVTPTDWKSAQWWRNRPPLERWDHVKVPKRYQDCAVSNYDTRIGTWMQNFKPGDNLLVWGPPGCGKTVQAVATIRYLVTGNQLSGKFIDSDDYIEMLKDSFDSGDGLLPEMYSTPHLLKYIKGVFDVVLLDGLGQERRTDFAVHELGSLLRRRHDHALSTIVTSTHNSKELVDIYGDRLRSVLADYKQVGLGR